MIKILTEAIPYWSRYPIPKNWQQIKDEIILTEKHHLTYNELYHKLRKKIYFETRFGWKGPNEEMQGEWYCSEYDDILDLSEVNDLSSDEIYYKRKCRIQSAST